MSQRLSMLELLQGWKASVSVLDTSMAFGMKVNAVELSDELWGNFRIESWDMIT